MNIRIVKYVLSASPFVAAFVSIEVDGWLRVNGLNFHRDGTLRAAQLTPMSNGKNLFINAVEILDADIAKQLTAEILAAIHAHIALLPPERRERPPITPKPRAKPNPSPAAQGAAARKGPAEQPPAPPVAAPPPKASASLATPKLKPLPPPQRLLAPRPLRPAIGNEQRKGEMS